MEEKLYVFTVYLIGSGENTQEAWNNAIKAFALDPGSPDEVREVEEGED